MQNDSFAIEIKSRLEEEARSLGFELFGVAPATNADGFSDFEQWLDAECAGEMHYLQKNRAARQHPASILSSVRSVIMLGIRYAFGNLRDEPVVEIAANHGRIARYAHGIDYHQVVREKLNLLSQIYANLTQGGQSRGVVDSAPLLERDFARRAGLGWIGKNTMLIHPQLGSFFFLAGFLIDLELPPSIPFTAFHCGSCTACIQACPTQAIEKPGWLDARKCISYLTIELKGSIPDTFRGDMGDWLFGCDICQEVCPWNRKAQLGSLNIPRKSDLLAIELLRLFEMSDGEFKSTFGQMPIMRAKRNGLLRNAAIVLGNQGDARAIPVLKAALQCENEIVAEACRWALERLLSRESCNEI